MKVKRELSMALLKVMGSLLREVRALVISDQ